MRAHKFIPTHENMSFHRAFNRRCKYYRCERCNLLVYKNENKSLVISSIWREFKAPDGSPESIDCTEEEIKVRNEIIEDIIT